MTEEIELIKKTIAALEAQRTLLGDAVVDTALSPLQDKLAALQPQPGAEQRKQVTVLFADLVGFTQMSGKMDPEDIREIVNAYFTRWSSSIEKHGGVVEKFIGDAVMAVFGLSTAREDDPENAIQAALDMRQALAGLNEALKSTRGIQLSMRTGIHTGLAMISILDGRQAQKEGQGFVAVGDTVNLASRLQAAAPEGGILISHDTYRLVRGIFDIQVQSPIEVKGKVDPVQVYLVLRAKQRTFHTPARGVEGVETRMIGRDAELQQMKAALPAAMQPRRTQVVVITGEAGIGKSRLINEFTNWLEMLPEVVRIFKCRASPSMENLPYSLFRDMISFRFQIQDSDPAQAVQAKIETGLGEFNHPDNPRRARFIGGLLGYRLPGGPALEGAGQDPLAFHDTTLAYLTDYFKDVASIRTIVLMLEDIHWADDSSLDLLDQLLLRLARQPMLVVCAARPELYERRPGWGQKGNWGEVAPIQIALKPLSQSESVGLTEDILQKVEVIPRSLHSLIINSAEGNPFFTEEFIKMLIEAGVILKEEAHWRIDLTQLEKVAIPTTLVEVLQARFDSLILEERVLLQRASVVGRTFWDAAVGSMEADQEDQIQLTPRMEAVLRVLSAREMIFPVRSSAFESTHEFIFKHALLRDVIYGSVLKRLRKIYHAYAAAWLEAVTQRSGRSDEYAALIAEHYEHAEDLQRAQVWYQNAGTQAMERYANAEAIRCFSHCLELMPKGELTGRYELLLRRARLFDTISDRPAQKSDLETLLSIAGRIDQSASTGEAPEAQPKKSHRAEVLLQWWHYYDALFDTQAAITAAQQATALARSAGDSEMEATGRLFLGATAWKRSDYPAAEAYLERSLALARQAHSQNLEGDILRNLGVVLNYQEKYEQARGYYDAALQIYQANGNERGESMVLNSLGILLSDQGRLHEARTYLEQSLQIKQKIGHRRGVNTTLNNLGLVASKMGRYSEALKLNHQVLSSAAEIGDLEAQAEAYSSLGSIAIHLGSYQAAQEYLEQAIHTYRRFDSRDEICQALIAQAMLARQLGEPSSAVKLSREALALAQTLNLNLEQASALTNAGYALLGMGRAGEASESLHKALGLWADYVGSNMLPEVKAASARASLAQGRTEDALKLVEEVLAALIGHPKVNPQNIRELAFSALEGMEEPFEALLNSYLVLDSAGDPRAKPLLDSAYRLLSEQAAWIEDESLRESFLENIAAHKEITTRWNKQASLQAFL